MLYRPQKRVFISFDYDHDRHYRYLLSALKENTGSAISFIDVTPGEINTSDVGRVKAVLTQRIKDATHTLVIVGQFANSSHRDAVRIGERNWQWWEIEKSKQEGKKLIMVKINSGYGTPTPLLNAGASRAMSFTVPSIVGAIQKV